MAETIGKFFCIKCGETTIEKREKHDIGYSYSNKLAYTVIVKMDNGLYIEDEMGVA